MNILLKPVSMMLSLTLLTSNSFAASCGGVEFRVNSRTSELDSNVQTHTEKTEKELVDQELSERDRLLAALQVLVKQESVSSEQTQATIKATTEATANAYVAQRQRLKVLDAKQRYSSVGYDPCSVQSKASSYAQAIKSSDSKAKSISGGLDFKPGEYGDPKGWYSKANSNSSYSAASLYSGNESEAKDYINFIIGAPDEKVENIQGTASGDFETLNKNQVDAYKSASASILAAVAAENSSVNDAGKELASHWMGKDGGQKWAAATTDQQTRGVLQDLIRIEATNIAFQAQGIKSRNKTEFAAAVYLLSLVNASVTPSNEEGEGKFNYIKKASAE